MNAPPLMPGVYSTGCKGILVQNTSVQERSVSSDSEVCLLPKGVNVYAVIYLTFYIFND